MSEWKQYKRKGLSEMRPYVKGESLVDISVSPEDDPETDMGMVARNPKNHKYQWYVARSYFEDNLEKEGCEFCFNGDGDQCDDIMEEKELGLICTRELGHDGQHIACGIVTHDIRRWGKEEEPQL